MTPTSRFHTRRRLAVLFLIPLAFSLLFFFVSILSEHTDVELLQIENLSASISGLRTIATDIESGERGYLLTMDEGFLVPYQNARGDLETRLGVCLQNASDQSPEISQELGRLASAIRRRLAEADRLIELAKRGDKDGALAAVRSGDGDRTMNEIRQQINDLQGAIGREEASYINHQQQLNRWSFVVFLVGTSVMILVLSRLYRATVSYLHERDAADERLQELNASLEAQIEERTRDLRIANEELQQFAYVASHDLQEPLRTITSFSQLIEARYKSHLDEDADEFIGYIVTSARRMTDLINGLLAMARLRRTGQPVDPVPFADIIGDAVSSLQVATRESGARITHGELPHLIVDRVQFLQVLQNLILNAIKYRSDACPEIEVSAERSEGYWTFAVRDNGRGFDSQFAERIFGLFQRLHGRESVEGTGMGLAIARKVVERHGGRIWADSTPGKGSTFYFSLPVSLEAAKEVEVAD